MIRQFSVDTPGQGLHEITAAEVHEGLCTVFVRHTPASLVIQENADPTLPDGDPFYSHDAEGPDDMPSHIKQGIYLWEHRRGGSRRELVVHIAQ